MARKKSQTRAGKAIVSAITDGIETLVGVDPIFRNNRDYIAKYFLDQNLIQQKAKELVGYARQKGFSGNQTLNYVHKGIEDYVTSGRAFNEEGKKAILNETLEGKAKSGLLKGFGARKALRAEDYLRNALLGAYELGDMIVKKRMAIDDPGVVKVMKYVQEAGMLVPELRLLRDSGKLRNSEYRTAIRNIYSNIVSGTAYAAQAVKNYANSRMDYIKQFSKPQNIAASILGIFGVTLALMGMKFTGAVAGVSSSAVPTAVTTIGIFSFIMAILIFVKK